MNERPGHQRLAAWLTCRSCESLSSRRDTPEEHCPSKAPCLAGATCTQAAWECSVPSPCPGAGKAAALSPSPADVLMSHRNFQRERAEDEDETIRSPEACQDLIANSYSYHRRHPLPGGDRVATSILCTSGAIAVTHSGPMVGGWSMNEDTPRNLSIGLRVVYLEYWPNTLASCFLLKTSAI